jgi:hypothetical protein
MLLAMLEPLERSVRSERILSILLPVSSSSRLARRGGLVLRAWLLWTPRTVRGGMATIL